MPQPTTRPLLEAVGVLSVMALIAGGLAILDVPALIIPAWVVALTFLYQARRHRGTVMPRRVKGLRVVLILVGIIGVGLLLGGCNFAASLWGIAEDVIGPQGMLLRQIESTGGSEDPASRDLWRYAEETFGPLSQAGQQLHSGLVQRLKSG